MRSELLKNISRIVVKLGTGVLTDSRKQLDPAQLEQIVAQVAALRQSGKEAVLVTSGHYESSPSSVLESARFGEVMEKLHERFQFVVFDSAPVNVYTDALILGPRMDGTVFVIEADRTRIDEAQRAKRQLERGGTKMLGALLNRRKNYLPAFVEEMI